MKSEVDYPYVQKMKNDEVPSVDKFKKVVKVASCSKHIKLVDRSTITI